MRWVKRGLWTAAWCVWVWLGFGLYRELPRDLGPVVCTLPILDSHEEVLGFVGNDLVVCRSNALAQTTQFTVWDLKANQKLHDLRGPLSVYPKTVSLRHGMILGVPCNGDGGEKDTANWHALDLRTGVWKDLGVKSALRDSGGRVHPSKPWVAIQGGEIPKDLVVVDLASGGHVFSHRTNQGDRTNDTRFNDFCWADDDELLVFRRTVKWEDAWLDRWNVNQGRLIASERLPALDDNAIIPGAGGGIEYVGNGFVRHHEIGPIVVLGQHTGRITFKTEPVSLFPNQDGRRLPAAIGVRLPRFSDDGRAFMAVDAVLWSVESGRIIWRPAEFETVYGGPDGESFLVLEESGSTWWGRALSLKLTTGTWAVRDLGSGALRHRVLGKHPRLDHVSRDGSLGVDYDGSVFKMSPRVNYPLLAFCQTILALPLILLWSILRWRRNRRLRLAGVQL